MKITKRCKIKFVDNVDYDDEVECKVAPPDSCEVMFGNPYLLDMDATLYKKENKYHLVKGGGRTSLAATKQVKTKA